MQKKEQALCMTQYSKHKGLLSADILKNYFAVTLVIIQTRATSQENRTFQNTWQTSQSDQHKFNKHIHCSDMELSYSQAKHQQALVGLLV